jgi:DtxR family Mn-dependent transcriptional regulator
VSTVLTEALEDYLEAIYDIIDDKGGVRVKDIAGRIGVKNSSVTVALRNLRDARLINYEPYGVISLTRAGYDEARRLSETHQVFRRFFIKVLGVDRAAADETACRLEHAMAPNVMARFLQFMKFISTGDSLDEGWGTEFKKFCRQNDVSPGNLAAPADYMSSTAGGPDGDSK